MGRDVELDLLRGQPVTASTKGRGRSPGSGMRGTVVGITPAGVQAVCYHGDASTFRAMCAAFDSQYPRVFVYWNVRRKQFSIQAINGAMRGRVLGHADLVEVFGATLRVNEARRQRVIETGRKNVHAGVVGDLGYVGPNSLPHADDAVRIAYNPRKAATFVSVDDGFPVRFADRVILSVFASYAEGAKVCDCDGFFQAGAFVHRSACLHADWPTVDL
jgi:hypothetical protein